MSASIIDGKAIAEQYRTSLKHQVDELKNRGIHPALAVVLVGDNPASLSYVNAKERDCETVGIQSRDIRLPADTSQNQLLTLIDDLNTDPAVHGILVQLPLPSHINEETIINALSPTKDVDGFHPHNMGNLMLNLEGFIPCTPLAVINMLETSGFSAESSHVVIAGRSRIVGAPLANLLFRKAPKGNATVTVCHSATNNLEHHVRQADILVAAMGRPGVIDPSHIKPGAIVIDVGINRIPDPSRPRGYRLVGDIDYPRAREIARAITPVPGGVGPVTRAMLLHNTVQAARLYGQA